MEEPITVNDSEYMSSENEAEIIDPDNELDDKPIQSEPEQIFFPYKPSEHENLGATSRTINREIILQGRLIAQGFCNLLEQCNTIPGALDKLGALLPTARKLAEFKNSEVFRSGFLGYTGVGQL